MPAPTTRTMLVPISFCIFASLTYLIDVIEMTREAAANPLNPKAEGWASRASRRQVRLPANFVGKDAHRDLQELHVAPSQYSQQSAEFLARMNQHRSQVPASSAAVGVSSARHNAGRPPKGPTVGKVTVQASFLPYLMGIRGLLYVHHYRYHSSAKGCQPTKGATRRLNWISIPLSTLFLDTCP